MPVAADLDVPRRLAALPRNKAGYVVPWFIAWVDGEPDFRIIGPGKPADALRFDLCWLCGQPAGAYRAFVIGPMCAVNRTTAEPGSHLDCARYAARVCPFLSVPNMRRRTTGLPEGHVDPGGVMLTRNPGAACVWVTKRWSLFDAPGGQLLELGPPTSVEWYAEGRTATVEEIEASVTSGMPALLEACDHDANPERSRGNVHAEVDRLLAYVRGERPSPMP
jgi:hypothetical protein